ncbi:hypothetical protein [Bradyrhizobium sp. SZCCHNRI1058]|uniref:hypothetical protein n=1 Tax=Bradyrhizobium sp. SZCCHNRI1058 TaxID=3057279 RepID=UPI002915CF57|nr:hypothetical protein [Bradyrhizobium sp. SZCCHNRI1058]
MAATPLFIATPQIWQAQVTAANTNRDGTGTLVTLVTGNTTPGTRLDKIRAQAAGSTTLGIIRYFLNDGTNKRLIKERPVLAVTPSASAPAFEDEWTLQDGLVLPNASWSIMVGTHNGETFNIFGFGGNL